MKPPTQGPDRGGEAQYQDSIRRVQSEGAEPLGLMTSWAWQDDPKRLGFTLARYKFVAKMMRGKKRVLEAGCGDGFASRVVAQAVGTLVGIDIDPAFVADARSRPPGRWPIEFRHHDLMSGPVQGTFDGVYSLDVVEHIEATDEATFLRHMIAPLTEHGVCIVGMPSLESQPHASAQSRDGHVNCKTQDDLASLMENFFHQVFMFAMNDEVVHTGFHAMAHYNIALCCGKKT